MTLAITFNELVRYTNEEREKWRRWFGEHAAALDAPVQPGGRLPTVGKLIAEIPAGGSKVTNLCFWEKSVYLTVAERHSIHRLDVGVAGKAYTK